MSKRSNPIHNTVSFLIVALLFSFYGEAALAQSTAFTYQGRLTDGGGPVSGQYDLQFQIFAALSGGTALGTVQLEDQPVTNGVFSVQLNFGAVNFNNNGAQFLEIGIRPGNQTGAYTPLTPRQQITSTPYAIKSLNAATADGLSLACVNCVTSDQISSVSGSQVSGLIPVASVPPSSGSYVQNTTTPAQSADFNINGTGTANVFSAATQYNIGVQRMLSAPGGFNTFVGRLAGRDNTGGNNTFVGDSAGATNTTGSSNVFFGNNAGQQNSTGSSNAFFGEQAGFGNTMGSNNTFIGESSGSSNTTESNNTALGNQAGVSAGITNATALGFQAKVTQSNSLVLGSISGVNNATADTFVGIGISDPFFKLHIKSQSGAGLRVQTNTVGGILASFGSRGFFDIDTPSRAGGRFTVMDNGNVGIGSPNPASKLEIVDSANTGLRVQTDTVGGTVASFGSLGDFQIDASSLAGGRFVVKEDGKVGVGTPIPLFKLHVKTGADQNLVVRPGSDFSGGLTGIGLQSVNDTNATYQPLDLEGSQITLNVGSACCGGNVGIGTANPDRTLTVNGTADKPGGGSWDVFSDERLKTIKGRFMPGLKAVMQLQPVRYEYKPDNALGLRSSGEHVGFGAQAVQKIIPEAVTKNDRGYLLVNNDPILWTMLNAIKEQQQQILALRREIVRLKTRIVKTDRRLMLNGRIP